jgi:CHAT domain-containing protein/Flp pilus assembly protein TadD
MHAAAGRLTESAAESHLHECKACKQEINDWRAAHSELAAVRAPAGGVLEDCPSAEALANYLAGAAGTESGAILQHVATCSRCAAIATAVTEPECPRAPIPMPRKTRMQRYRWYAIAAAVVLAAGAWAWWSLLQATPEVLLAKAYTAARPFEYRLPDNGYSPVAQKRGDKSVFDRPDSLTAAELDIQRRLAKQPDDPSVLALKGRAELLEHAYDKAIETLSRASELAPEDEGTLADFGCALALRGDIEKRNIDYGHAIDVWLRALKSKPRDGVLLFNLALVEEKLTQNEEALNRWKQFLDTRPGVDWAREAQDHINELHKKIEQRKRAEIQVIRNAAAFLMASGDRDLDVEPYQETFWREWLPRQSAEPQSREAAFAVGRRFVERFGDRSLLDTVSTAVGMSDGQAVSQLAQVLVLSQSGNSDAAIQAASAASAKLTASGLIAAALRARLELAYSYNRSAQRADCLRESEEVARAAESRSYIWIAEVAHLAHAACSNALGQTGAARAEIETAYRAFNRAGFHLQSLLALGLLAALDNSAGNYAAVWENAPEGLRQYWSTSASDFRAQQFQYDLQKSAASLGWSECAVAMMRGAVRFAAKGGNPAMEIADRVELASLLVRTGEYRAQEEELDAAAKAVRTIRDGPTRENLEWNLQLERGEAEIAAGHSAAAIQRIDGLTRDATARRITEQMRMHQARGLALARTGDSHRAAEAFAAAIELNRRRLESLRSYADRLAEIEMASASYRGLAEILSGQDDGCARSREVWQRYRDQKGAAPVRGPVITYGVLRGGIVVWTTDGGSCRMRRVAMAVERVRAAALRFSERCASPDASLAEIRGLGHDLFQWLIGPELRAIGTGGRAVLQSDLWVAAIPFAALTDDSGQFVARSFVLSESGDDAGFTRESSALVVSIPTARTPGGGMMPILSGAEAESRDVAARFQKAVLLHDEGASESSLALRAPAAELFHFSGHGWSDGGNGALMLPAVEDAPPQFVTSRTLASEHWGRCSLAVLSACLTAAGEQRGPVNNQSLVRALLSAGAQRVMAARWSIDSSATRVLMGRFYDGLLEGIPPAAALARAESEIAVSTRWNLPYYWASFEIFGRASALKN